MRRDNYEALTDDLRALIDQVTLRKKEFAQNLLRSRNQPSTGVRDVLRERLAKALVEGAIAETDLRSLFEELEMWGDQRIRLLTLPTQLLQPVRQIDELSRRLDAAGATDVLGAPHRISESERLEFLWAEQLNDGVSSRLRIVAGKRRVIETRLKDVDERTDANLPNIVFIPYQREYQNALTFLEVNLTTGDALLSTTKLPLGYNYSAEYEEFKSLVFPVIDLSQGGQRDLRVAVGKINRGLPETKRHGIRRRTNLNTVMNITAASRNLDLGGDADANPVLNASQSHNEAFANCTWLMTTGLEREVHTHIFAPEGEVTILHQVQERDVRYVLSRVHQLN